MLGSGERALSFSVEIHVWLTRFFHLNESVLLEAGLLQKHFPSQNTNWAEKTLAGNVITTKTHTLLLSMSSEISLPTLSRV